MKLTSYLLPVLVLVVSIMGYLIARDQSTTLTMLVGARSGLGAGSGGMELLNRDLNTESIAVAKTRSTALKDNETTVLEFEKARGEMEDVKKTAEETAAEVEKLRGNIEVAEKDRGVLTEEKEKIQNLLRAVPGLEDSDLDSAVEDLGKKVQEGASEYASLLEDREKYAARREELKKEVADRETELESKNEINERFMQAYRRNGEDFAISAVVSVNNGQVVAEYDEQKLPSGVVPEVGDRVFRKAVQGS